jgi:hypothetical protein
VPTEPPRLLPISLGCKIKAKQPLLRRNPLDIIELPKTNDRVNESCLATVNLLAYNIKKVKYMTWEGRLLEVYTDEEDFLKHVRVYPKVSGLAAWNENCKWYSSLPLGAVVSLFCESV